MRFCFSFVHPADTRVCRPINFLDCFKTTDIHVHAVPPAPRTDMPDHHPPRVWQTDTGPLAVPDLFHRHENPVDGVSLGYIAINNLQPGNADFVVEQSVPIGEEKVMHFGAPFTLKAKSRLLCVPPPV